MKPKVYMLSALLILVSCQNSKVENASSTNKNATLIVSKSIGSGQVPEWAKAQLGDAEKSLNNSYIASTKFKNLVGKRFPVKIEGSDGIAISLKQVNIIFANTFNSDGMPESSSQVWDSLVANSRKTKGSQIIRLAFNGLIPSDDIPTIDQRDQQNFFLPNSGIAEKTLGIFGELTHVWILNKAGIVTGHFGPGSYPMLSQKNTLNRIFKGDIIGEPDPLYSKSGFTFNVVKNDNMNRIFNSSTGVLYLSDSQCVVCQKVPNLVSSLSKLLPAKTSIIYISDQSASDKYLNTLQVKLNEAQMAQVFGDIYLKPRIIIFSKGLIKGEIPFSLNTVINKDTKEAIKTFAPLEYSIVNALKSIHN